MAFLPRLFGVVLILCMLMLVTVPAPPISHKPPPAGYRMALFWPPGFCYLLGDDCDKNKVFDDTFTAHGLWPSKATGGSMDPQWGNPGWMTNFNPIQGNLKLKLTPYWKNYNMSLGGGKAEKVWQYEWDKHGENGHFSQDDYFDRVVDLTQEYGKKIVQILAEKGITPKHINEGGYQLAHIEAALLQGLGNIKPEIVCPERKEAPGVYVRKEIRLILDSNAKQLRNANSKICQKQAGYSLPL